VAKLVDRLSVRLGAEAVRRPVRQESHVPERANGWVNAVKERPSTQPSPASGRGSERPQRLLDRPEAIAVVYATPEGLPRRFVWRRAVHDIARVEGPERIAPEWWRERSSARLRDYYRVEDGQGRRYWIYREGVFGDGRGGAPEWYLHGLFG
jgi:protein ImuB